MRIGKKGTWLTLLMTPWVPIYINLQLMIEPDLRAEMPDEVAGTRRTYPEVKTVSSPTRWYYLVAGDKAVEWQRQSKLSTVWAHPMLLLLMVRNKVAIFSHWF